MAATRLLPILSLDAAKVASEASQQKAEEIGVDVNIAIVDSTLQLLHFARMTNAKLTSVDIAINKAFTAAGHRVPTSNYNTPTFFPGGMGFGIQYTNGGRFCTLTGGVPIVIDGVVVGAMGVSSGTAEQDVEIAETGIKAMNTLIKRTQGPRL
ncbi:hypothetical protein E4T42_08965 [Aureobasidium subglaciale]|uniref:DUF336-domain-containing protein n=1 Tax=Aureobasidium subglaciale (strain EXF-2481) TaxID=1043005 RepID=A0A074XXP0_AURSE|nr:uncharacterized protein AUEXF2481DRAFT_45282 [Aureobasidium subglaciale EXF-2481]KAI5194261.1 hypothetical protein E4T38_09629 [Aureobasidium subglaciale]KAI5213646.1 hypothetical protein E4T40_09571 [Aureobasidium subglaciale]KAI5215387.1 hypothetical protein E4T41_09609 [Aureobasidium subglaciale]KAI5238525.1 hypothetical protein E4T42_08965 [Aureobasidium subglaciale]KAI5253293.1 hypothetical protein E4T46_09586 [Aureobasidium subglaciale]